MRNKLQRVKARGIDLKELTGKSWAQRIHEIPETTKVYVKRNLMWLTKRYGIQRRLLKGQYKPRYRKAKNSNQIRAIYLLERGINPNEEYISCPPNKITDP